MKTAHTGMHLKSIPMHFMHSMPSMFSPEAKQQYERVEELAMNMIGIDTEEAFIQGFRLGARLILDVLTDYRGSFYSLAERQPVEK